MDARGGPYKPLGAMLMPEKELFLREDLLESISDDFIKWNKNRRNKNKMVNLVCILKKTFIAIVFKL
jgi:hypothetical protein